MDKSGWVIGEELARQARARGHRTFLTFQSHPDVTYAEADEIAHRVSRGVAALGVGPGDRVGVWLPNGPEILHASFGIYRAGAVAVFVNTGYRGIFLEHVLNWTPNHRTEDDLNRLFAGSAFGRPCTSLRRDERGATLLAECIK